MADVSAIRSGIKTNIETLTGLIAVFDYVPDRLVAPSASVEFLDAEYHETSSVAGYTLFTFVVTILAARFDSEFGQQTLDGYISGSNSFPSCIDADPTLAGTASGSTAKTCRSYGMITVADSQFWGAQFDVEVIA